MLPGMTRPVRRRTLFAVALALGGGCSATYYKMWSELGYEKRDILVSKVEKARDAQTAAKDQFKTTLDQFKAVTSFNGGDLEAEYRKLNGSYTDCKARADAVGAKIDAVDKVATDMFAEWNGELSQYSDQGLRAKSQQELDDSKQKYDALLTAMRKSQASMTPVLQAFNDQVLFLKHNLNASAISSLQTTAAGIDANVQQLIAEMNKSIDEANTFISGMKKS